MAAATPSTTGRRMASASAGGEQNHFSAVPQHGVPRALQDALQRVLRPAGCGGHADARRPHRRVRTGAIALHEGADAGHGGVEGGDDGQPGRHRPRRGDAGFAGPDHRRIDDGAGSLERQIVEAGQHVGVKAPSRTLRDVCDSLSFGVCTLGRGLDGERSPHRVGHLHLHARGFQARRRRATALCHCRVGVGVDDQHLTHARRTRLRQGLARWHRAHPPVIDSGSHSTIWGQAISRPTKPIMMKT